MKKMKSLEMISSSITKRIDEKLAKLKDRRTMEKGYNQRIQ